MTGKDASAAGVSLSVAFVIGSLEIGGAELQTCRLAGELRARGHRVEVIALGPDGPARRVLDRFDVPCHVLDAWSRHRPAPRHHLLRRVSAVHSISRAALRVIRILRRIDPDVCQATLFHAYLLGMPAAALAGVPARISGRRRLDSDVALARSARWLQWLSIALSHAIVANCDAVAQDAISADPVPPSKIHVIYNGLDLPTTCADPRSVPAVGIMVANLLEHKGHADVIRALAALDDPPLIRFVGGGPEYETLAELARTLHVDGVCSFDGPTCDPVAQLQTAQFAVLASHTEGLPNALLEEMASGLPPIATDVGGVKELITDGYNGTLVPPKAPARLADAIQAMCADESIRVLYGNRNRLRAATFDWDTCTRRHEDLYRSLLPKRIR